MVRRSWMGGFVAPLLMVVGLAGMGISTDVPDPPPEVAAAVVPMYPAIAWSPSPTVPVSRFEVRDEEPPRLFPNVSRETIAPPPPPPAPVLPPVPVADCSLRVDEATMLAYVARHDWDGYAVASIARVFLLESGGGCVDVVSPTNDWGCTQIHRGYGRDAWVDFDRLLVDCEYAVEVARELWAEREAAGLCGPCGWYAGEGWLW